MADDDMTNSNGDPRLYSDAATAQLGERVTNLGRRQSDLESEMRTGFRQMETAFTAFSNETRTSIASLSTNIAERNRPQWQALSVMLAFAAILGGLAYMPIREATTDLKGAVAALAATTVTRQELEWRTARSMEDRSRSDANLRDLRDDLVPRAEHARVWQSYDQRLSDQQRQVDELKQAAGSVYSQRDALMDMRERLDRLERLRASASPSPIP